MEFSPSSPQDNENQIGEEEDCEVGREEQGSPRGTTMQQQQQPECLGQEQESYLEL